MLSATEYPTETPERHEDDEADQLQEQDRRERTEYGEFRERINEAGRPL